MSAAHGPPIRVPAEVKRGILAVRDSSLTNMFDIRAVQRVASDLGFFETVMWIYEHTHEYRQGIWNGWEAVE